MIDNILDYRYLNDLILKLKFKTQLTLCFDIKLDVNESLWQI